MQTMHKHQQLEHLKPNLLQTFNQLLQRRRHLCLSH
jgi:hypothetical protein